MTELYPLKFKPIFKDKIWGGQKIKTILGKDFSPLNNCGELWALSGVKDDVSVVENGFLEGNDLNELIEIYMDELVGDSVYQRFGNEFPVLIKFLNSKDYLSVQVHPDDEMAWKNHKTNGKTEMWFIIDCDNDSELIIGLKNGTDKEKFIKELNNKNIQSVLNNIKIHAGDAFFIPAGRVHAIGKGVLLAEIQQTSDVTYRIYDWDRHDENGNARALHTQEALQAIDFKNVDDYFASYARLNNVATEIVNSEFFKVNNLIIKDEVSFDLAFRDSFTVFVCTKGALDVICYAHTISLKPGECVLIPAELNDITLKPEINSHLLEVYV